MTTVRTWIAASLTVLSLAFLALLTRALYEGAVAGAVSQMTLSMLFVVGFLIVAGVVFAVAKVPAGSASSRCDVCGSHWFMTVRSQDRRRVLTCFTCGREVAVA